jgi:ADP-dependent NAD(P)H-hydrate dehydratase / NAD(P)H-hydrate epimerase
MSIPILSIAQMRQWEQATWAAGKTEQQVISLAGKAVGRQAMQMTKDRARILILAGKGHNGDDARLAAEHISDRDLRLIDVVDPSATAADLPAVACDGVDLIIDGLFGIGLNRALDAGWVHLIEAINQTGIPVLAVDVPSGLNADTGVSCGAVIQAAVTLTLGAPKLGMFAPQAANWVGQLLVAPDIGLLKCPFTTEFYWVERQDFHSFPLARKVNTHKGIYGHLAVIAGSLGYHGAAVLAARGALRAQPGLVTVFPQESVYSPVAAQSQACMVLPWSSELRLPDSVTTVLVGPGLADPRISERFKTDIARLWQDSDLGMVVDASALEWLPSGSIPHDAVRCITPHPGEAARMLNTSTSAIQADRPGSVRRLSQQWGNCWVVLKGHQTLIGRQQGSIQVNSTGNPHLAQGGSGDLLSGYLAGLLAANHQQADVGQIVRYAVWQHGATADQLQASGKAWTIDDLAQLLGSCLTSR